MNIKSNLPVKTTMEKDEFAGFLEILKQSLYKKPGLSKTLTNDVPLKYSLFIKKLMEQNKISGKNQSAQQELLEEIGKKLKTLEQLNLTIAFNPTERNIENFYLWAVKNIGENTIINLEIDPSIVGGAIISYKGLYSDFSLKKEIEKAFGKKGIQKLLE